MLFLSFFHHVDIQTFKKKSLQLVYPIEAKFMFVHRSDCYFAGFKL